MPARSYRIILLVIAVVSIKLFSLQPLLVEKYYSTGMYPYIGRAQRILFGWIPFSIGDLFYAFLIVWMVLQLFRFVQAWRKGNERLPLLKRALLRLAQFVMIIYVSFNLLWGLNYNRAGIAYQMKLEPHNYSDSDLVNLTYALANQISQLQASSLINRDSLANKKFLFDGAVAAYKNLASDIPLMQYRSPSVKPSLYSYLGNYLGYTGYYNPFSGEAQVNTTVPPFSQPFTTCHEIGHQLGYAKESEANFAGFLSATRSDDPAFRYSVYFDMYAYASRYMYAVDSSVVKAIFQGFPAGVQKDIRQLRTFYERYSGPLETAIDRLYSEYLRANEQPSGKMSYNEVVGLLIAYHRKYGSN